MYPRNAASPPRIAVGAVVQISDGAVQTSGVSIKVRPEGQSASAGGNSPVYEEGIVLYTPTQAETDYTAFVVIAYKTGCIPVSVTVVTTASSTAGKVDVSHVAGTAQTAGDIKATLTDISGSGFLSSTDSLESIRNRGDLAWTTGAGIAATEAYAPSGAPVVTTGSVSSGAYTDLAAVDGTNLVVDEAATTNPGLDFYLPLMTAAGKKGVAIKLWGYYSGNASHFIRVQASVDGSTTVFEDIGTLANGTAISLYTFSLSPQHIKADGSFNLRFLHNAVAGVGTHKLYLDKVIVETVDAQASVVLADAAHGGAAATLELASAPQVGADYIATESGVGAIETGVEKAVEGVGLAYNNYISVEHWDGSQADVITASYSEAVGAGNTIILSGFDFGSTTTFGYVDDSGFHKDAGWTTFGGMRLAIEINRSGAVAFPAGTLTLQINRSVVGATPIVLTIPLPPVSTGVSGAVLDVLGDGTATAKEAGHIYQYSHKATLGNMAHGGAAASLTLHDATINRATAGAALSILAADGHGITVTAGGNGNAALQIDAANGADGVVVTNNPATGLIVNAGVSIDGGLSVAGAVLISDGATITNSAGNALTLQSAGGNGYGLVAEGDGTGKGISVVDGIDVAGGFAIEGGLSISDGVAIDNSAGDGLKITATDGHGISATAGGTDKHGMTLIKGTGTGKDIDADEIDAAGSLDAAGVRSALGMASANLDTQLSGIAADAATAAAGGVDQQVIEDAMMAAIASSAIATDADLSALEAKIDAFLATGYAIQTGSGGGTVGTQLVTSLFEKVLAVLNDPTMKAHKQPVLIAHYNRVIEEINSSLMMLGADVAINVLTIIGDGTNYVHELPENFLGFVPKSLRTRMPSQAQSNYKMGQPLLHADKFDPRLTQIPTTTGVARFFTTSTDGAAQFIKFDVIPTDGDFYDGLYFYKPTVLTSSNLATETTPWLGILDSLIMRMMEHYCREGLEFTGEARMLWIQRTTADAALLLSLRHLQTQEANPSSWIGLPR